jgi:hypothetical protein
VYLRIEIGCGGKAYSPSWPHGCCVFSELQLCVSIDLFDIAKSLQEKTQDVIRGFANFPRLGGARPRAAVGLHVASAVS